MIPSILRPAQAPKHIAALALLGFVLTTGDAHAATFNSLTLTPAQVVDTAHAGTVVGPLTIANTTRRSYRTEIVPVLLRQSRKGDLSVRDDAVAVKLARTLIHPTGRAFTLRPGGVHSVRALVRRVGEQRGVTAGVMFRAVPTRHGSGITNVLQLTGTVLLHPPGARTVISAGTMRAEQVAPSNIQILTPVENAGRRYATVRGEVTVRDARGRIVARSRIDPKLIIPRATVDLPAPLHSRLPAGEYRLDATVRSGGVEQRATGTMTLFGPGQVRTENARLVSVESPEGFIGEAFDLRAKFKNTGNVTYAPRAMYEVRSATSGPDGRVLARGPLTVAKARPGATGRIESSLMLPNGMRQATVTVVLTKGDRELDSDTVTTSLKKKPPLSERLTETVTQNALLIVGALFAALVAALGTVGVVLIRR
jgi:hypothetical protein